LVNDWKEEIKSARLIFYNNSVLASKIFFDENYIDRHDPRLRTYPFTTYKPTTEEVKRCYQKLYQINIISDQSKLLA